MNFPITRQTRTRKDRRAIQDVKTEVSTVTVHKVRTISDFAWFRRNVRWVDNFSTRPNTRVAVARQLICILGKDTHIKKFRNLGVHLSKKPDRSFEKIPQTIIGSARRPGIQSGSACMIRRVRYEIIVDLSCDIVHAVGMSYGEGAGSHRNSYIPELFRNVTYSTSTPSSSSSAEEPSDVQWQTLTSETEAFSERSRESFVCAKVEPFIRH